MIIEIKGVVGHNYEFTLSRKGLQIAEEAYRKSRYSGPAPVSLGAYRGAVQAQAFKPELTQESLTEHLSDLVLSEDIVRNLGAALMTGGAIFLYGPTGNGKTSIAERLKRIYHDYVYVPYAIEVSGEVLSVFDPIVHQPAEEQPEDIDPRWLLCHRPFLTVGGEMRADMLEPHVDQNRHIVRSPVQLRANNGILVIDDFGRQRIQPRDLLNRWIVPLDRHVDYISWFGTSIEIPFELIVVFATNLDVSNLAEEAFIRRIKNKIKIDRISDEIFLEIMRRQCGQRGIEYHPGWAVCRPRVPRALQGRVAGLLSPRPVGYRLRYRRVPAASPEVRSRRRGSGHQHLLHAVARLFDADAGNRVRNSPLHACRTSPTLARYFAGLGGKSGEFH